MTHWASAYIGLPWVRGGLGPHEFDCWGSFRFVQERHFGRAIPAIGATATQLERARLFATHEERSNWVEVGQPQEGDAVLMARAQHPVHIGVWILANHTAGALHCMQGAGVVYMRPAALRAAGWGRLTYYRHHPCTP